MLYNAIEFLLTNKDWVLLFASAITGGAIVEYVRYMKRRRSV